MKQAFKALTSHNIVLAIAGGQLLIAIYQAVPDFTNTSTLLVI